MVSRVDERPFAGECLVFGLARHGGRLAIVVESDFGVAGLITGHCERALIGDAQQRFAGATLDWDETVMQPTLEAVGRLLADPHAGLPLALDLRGSPVELAVWQALRRLPVRPPLSTRDFAQAYGLPFSLRDFDRACEANRIELAVPCHLLHRRPTAAQAA